MADENNAPPPAQQTSQSAPQPEAPPGGREWLETESLRASDPERGITFGGDHGGTSFGRRNRKGAATKGASTQPSSRNSSSPS